MLFKTKDKVAPTLTVHGKRYERENITHTFPAATDHFLPVLGLYEDFDNKVTIALSDGTSKTLTIVVPTAAAPDGFAFGATTFDPTDAEIKVVESSTTTITATPTIAAA